MDASSESLDALLDPLPPVPFAEALLLGVALYRVPVLPEALAWQVGWAPELPRNPEPEARPEVAWPERSEIGWELLVTLGLLVPVEGEDGIQHWQAHAAAGARLVELLEDEPVAQAHRRAALYWRWKAEKVEQSREQVIRDFVEARHHHFHAGELDQAVLVTHWICAQLHLWGEYAQEEALLHETLTWVPDSSPAAATFLGQLGLLAAQRGDAALALERYRSALAIHEALGDTAGIAGDYHQLGILAQDAGDKAEAQRWYQQSLTLHEQVADPAGMARTWHQLGLLAHEGGDAEAALELYRQSLAIEEELNDRAAMATSYHQLGVLAHENGDHATALHWYQRAYAILEERGDRANMALSLSQQGILHTERGVPAEAVDPTLHSLSLRLQLDLPVDTNLYWLNHQRELLGEGAFLELLDQYLDEESRDSLLERL